MQKSAETKRRVDDDDSDSDGVSPPIRKNIVVQGYSEYLREKDEADRK